MSSIRKINSRPSTGSGNHRRGSTGGSISGRSVGVVTPTTKGQTGPRTTGGKEIPLLDYGVNNKLDNMYSSMLEHNAGNNEFAQLLAALGIDEDRYLNQDQRADWNKQLMDAQLQYYQDLEKRQYTQQQLEEQRVYDSPLNQLARLMGAGVSRDAAIAMLSGQAGQPTIAESAVNTPGATASESRNAGLERALGIANTAINGVSAVAGLVGLGFSLPQAVEQTKFLKNQNFLTGRQNAAYQSAGQAYSILNKIGAGAQAFGSVTKAAAAIQSAAEKGDQDAALFIQNGGLTDMMQNAPFASQTLSSLYRSERDASDYNRSYSNQMRLMEAQTELAETDAMKVAQEITNLKAEFEEIWSRIWLNDENFYHQYLQNNVDEAIQNQVDPNTGKTGLELMTAKTLFGLVNDFKALSMTQNEEYWKDLADSILSEPAKVAAVNMLIEWQNSASLDMALASPALFRMTQAMQNLGFNDYLNTYANSIVTLNESGSVGYMGLGGSYSNDAAIQTKGAAQRFNEMVEATNIVGRDENARSKRHNKRK